jgi:hypothetical protein
MLRHRIAAAKESARSVLDVITAVANHPPVGLTETERAEISLKVKSTSSLLSNPKRRRSSVQE